MERGELDEVHWSQFALCAETDAEAFFPEQGGSTKMAKKVCALCEVKTECLADVLQLPISEQHGVAGGMDARARRKMLKAATV